MALHRQFDHDNLLGIIDYDVVVTKGKREVIAVFPLFKVHSPHVVQRSPLQSGTLLDRISMLAERGEFMSEHEVLGTFKSICLGVREFHKHEVMKYNQLDIDPDSGTAPNVSPRHQVSQRPAYG